jgi:hypothetical protein
VIPRRKKRRKKGVDFLTTDGHVSLPPAVTATVDGWVPDRKTRKKNKYLKTHVKQAVEFNNRSRTYNTIKGGGEIQPIQPIPKNVCQNIKRSGTAFSYREVQC